MKFLYAAYISTWIVHLSYAGFLLRRYVRLKNDAAELKK
jgi:hypothetical protein